MVDALLWIRDKLDARGCSVDQIGDRLQVPSAFREQFLRDTTRPWILVTGHRRESFGTGFEHICLALRKLTDAFPELGILYPVHLNPNVREPVNRLLGNNSRIALVEPASYEDFVW